MYQYQCVIPSRVTGAGGAGAARRDRRCRRGVVSGGAQDVRRLAVAGLMLSFPREGATLALDFPNRGAATLRLMERLDAIVGECRRRALPGQGWTHECRHVPRRAIRAGSVSPRIDRPGLRVGFLAAGEVMTDISAGGKRVVILGATSAIAEAAAQTVGRRGRATACWSLAMPSASARSPTTCAFAAPPRRGRGPRSCGPPTPRPSSTRMAKSIGAIDVVLLAYGVLGDQAAAEQDAGRARKILETDFLSAAAWCLAAANYLAARRAGVLIVVGSVAGDRGRMSNYIYGAAKGGLGILVQGIAHRLAPTGARAVLIKPGLVDTPMTAGMAPGGILWSRPDVGRGGDQEGGRARRPGRLCAVVVALRHVDHPERAVVDSSQDEAVRIAEPSEVRGDVGGARDPHRAHADIARHADRSARRRGLRSPDRRTTARTPSARPAEPARDRRSALPESCRRPAARSVSSASRRSGPTCGRMLDRLQEVRRRDHQEQGGGCELGPVEGRPAPFDRAPDALAVHRRCGDARQARSADQHEMQIVERALLEKPSGRDMPDPKRSVDRDHGGRERQPNDERPAQCGRLLPRTRIARRRDEHEKNDPGRESRIGQATDQELGDMPDREGQPRQGAQRHALVGSQGVHAEPHCPATGRTIAIPIAMAPRISAWASGCARRVDSRRCSSAPSTMTISTGPLISVAVAIAIAATASSATAIGGSGAARAA